MSPPGIPAGQVGHAGEATHAESPQRYDRRTILLHWATAALVATLWCVAEVIDDFSPGPQRIAARSVHILLGVCLAVLVLVRIRWRLGHGRRLPATGAGFSGWAEKSGHVMLYAMLVAVPLLGMANAWIRSDWLFGVVRIPGPADPLHALKSTVETLHKYAAHALVVIAGLHALVALAHHFILRDAVLGRMIERSTSTRSDT